MDREAGVAWENCIGGGRHHAVDWPIEAAIRGVAGLTGESVSTPAGEFNNAYGTADAGMGKQTVVGTGEWLLTGKMQSLSE